jgi:hypothetical protein
MSDRLVNVDNLCTNPENHKRHLCELSEAGKNDEIEKLQKDPRYVCNNCGQKSNSEGALCAPGPSHN